VRRIAHGEQRPRDGRGVRQLASSRAGRLSSMEIPSWAPPKATSRWTEPRARSSNRIRGAVSDASLGRAPRNSGEKIGPAHWAEAFHLSFRAS
jgi:hypothetical protein